MNLEDLKVEMVFEHTELPFYAQIIKIIKSTIFYLYIDDCDILKVNSVFYDDFLNRYELIEKVPSKIVEIVEETPIYISKILYDTLKTKKCILFKDVESDPILGIKILLTYGKKSDLGFVELCKAKKIIKKELNFCWDEGEWR